VSVGAAERAFDVPGMLVRVAGGMTRRDGPTLAERVAPGVCGAAVPPGPPSEPQRHCWVHGLPDAPGRWPGLLVEWRVVRPRAGGAARPSWVGRVVYAVDDDQAGDVVLVEAWVPARYLRPV